MTTVTFWGTKSLTSKFDFFSLFVLSKTVENESFKNGIYDSYSKVGIQKSTYKNSFLKAKHTFLETECQRSICLQ